MQFTYLMADTVYMRMASTRQSQNGNDIYSLVGFYDREGVSFAFAHHHHHHHNQTIEPPIQPAPERGNNTSFFSSEYGGVYVPAPSQRKLVRQFLTAHVS